MIKLKKIIIAAPGLPNIANKGSAYLENQKMNIYKPVIQDEYSLIIVNIGFPDRNYMKFCIILLIHPKWASGLFVCHMKNLKVAAQVYEWCFC